jgi:hypothetical protein
VAPDAARVVVCSRSHAPLRPAFEVPTPRLAGEVAVPERPERMLLPLGPPAGRGLEGCPKRPGPTLLSGGDVDAARRAGGGFLPAIRIIP